jgi:hypothetical protein
MHRRQSNGANMNSSFTISKIKRTRVILEPRDCNKVNKATEFLFEIPAQGTRRYSVSN